MFGRNSFGATLTLSTLVLLIGVSLAGASTFVPLGSAPTSGGVVDVQVSELPGDVIRLEYTLTGFTLDPVQIEGRTYQRVILGDEGHLLEAGLPELPTIARSVIIPDNAEMEVRVVSATYRDFESIDVAPSKGNLLRTEDPVAVPFRFGTTYGENAWWPEKIATSREPYILRDFRGLTVLIDPIQYNAVTHALRAYDRIVVEIVPVGLGGANVIDRVAPPTRVNAAFGEIYRTHFLNAGGDRYTPIDEVGEMLVIANDAWVANMVPFVAWKNQMGIKTTLVAKSEVGTTAAQFKTYIQSFYNTHDLAFVLLIGDAAQIPSLTNGGAPADPMYALVNGTDSYPDIFVGRLSAESPAQVDLQVTKFVEYERDPAAGAAWYAKGVGIGSGEGAGIGDDGEADYQHIENIRTDLLGFTYTYVDQLYPISGFQATAQLVANAVNEGRTIIDYCGHGSMTSWSTTGFSNSHVDALTNDNKLPFIISVACVNGQFQSGTCFAEAWLRADNNATGEPTGAVGMYASTVNMSWAPPMAAQDESVDLLVGQAKRTFGALCFSGSCQMMDEYGSGGESEFKNWHIFGDPSMRVRTAPATALTVQHGATIDPQATSFAVTVPGVSGALCALSKGGEFIGSAFTDASGIATVPVTEPLPADNVTLTVTYFNKLPYVAVVNVGQSAIPTIMVDPTEITATIELHGSTMVMLTVTNTGQQGSTLVFDVDTAPAGLNPWLNADPSHGEIPAGEALGVAIMFEGGNLPTGTYTGHVTFDSNAGRLEIPVTLIVEDFSGVEDRLDAAVLSLSPASPNPFGGATAIAFALPQSGPARLGVYDMSGRLVRTLATGTLVAGVHRYDWDGADDQGHALPGGVYLYRLEADGRRLTGKVMALR